MTPTWGEKSLMHSGHSPQLTPRDQSTCHLKEHSANDPHLRPKVSHSPGCRSSVCVVKPCGLVHPERRTFRSLPSPLTSQGYATPLRLLPGKLPNSDSRKASTLKNFHLHSLEKKGMFEMIVSSLLVTCGITKKAQNRFFKNSIFLCKSLLCNYSHYKSIILRMFHYR